MRSSPRPGCTFACLLLSALPPALRAQAPVDSALAAYIASVRAIDSHAHPMRPVRAGAPADTDFDALPLDGIPPFGFQHRLSLDDPVWRRAQDSLFHVSTGSATSNSDRTYHAALARSAALAV